jgi:hypothetical protein
MNLGVAGIPQRIETPGPGSNDARNSQQYKTSEGDGEHQEDKSSQQGLELLAGNAGTDELNKSNKLEEAKDT